MLEPGGMSAGAPFLPCGTPCLTLRIPSLTPAFPQTPHLVNLNEDPLMSECLLYHIKDGITR